MIPVPMPVQHGMMITPPHQPGVIGTYALCSCIYMKPMADCALTLTFTNSGVCDRVEIQNTTLIDD
jgi:hypothetical protein